MQREMASEEYVLTDLRLKGTMEKMDKVGELGNVSPMDSSRSEREGREGEEEWAFVRTGRSCPPH